MFEERRTRRQCGGASADFLSGSRLDKSADTAQSRGIA